MRPQPIAELPCHSCGDISESSIFADYHYLDVARIAGHTKSISWSSDFLVGSGKRFDGVDALVDPPLDPFINLRGKPADRGRAKADRCGEFSVPHQTHHMD
jgi:hypothetical protein